MDLKWSVVVEHWPDIAGGFLITVELFAIALGLGTIIGLFLALARTSPNPLFYVPASVYSWVLRGVPTLIVLFFAYFALPFFDIRMSPFSAAILGLATANAAYNMEIFRSGLIAIDPGQWEAARALGLPYGHTMRRIIIPQAIRVVIPPYFSNATAFLQATSLAAIVTVNDLLGVANRWMSFTYRPFEFLITAAALYIAINTAVVGVQLWAERRSALT